MAIFIQYMVAPYLKRPLLGILWLSANALLERLQLSSGAEYEKKCRQPTAHDLFIRRHVYASVLHLRAHFKVSRKILCGVDFLDDVKWTIEI